MRRCVICFCFIVLIVRAHARLAVTDSVLSNISNEIDKNEAVTEAVTVTIDNKANNDLQNNTLDHDVNKQEVKNNSMKESDLNVLPYKTNETCRDNMDQDIRNNIIETEDDVPCESNDVEANEILRLTNYIEEGRIHEARKAAKVNPDLFLGFQSYSGFFTVNKTYDSNIFFWYFPVYKKPVNETPWIIWLQGGPGASSMTGLFEEIGPFKINRNKLLVPNPYSWLQNHSLVFIDNPVGTGCSFTKHEDGYVTDMETYTKHLYSTLSQFLQLFPELRTAPLYVAGESYAGKYVPALGMEIHKHKEAPGGNINFGGMMIGNAYVEPGMIKNIADSFYHFGMLVQEQLDIVKPLVDKFHEDILENRSIKAKEKFGAIISLLLFLSNQHQAYNFLRDEISFGRYEWYLRQPEVKKALHIGDITHSYVNVTVNMKLAPDFLSNTRPMFESLLNEYRVLAYCGQLDQMLPCASTAKYYRKWRWTKSAEFLNATRYPLMLKNRLVGYHKTGGGLTEALIRGAGHMAPQDAPSATQELVTNWTHQQELTRPSDNNIEETLEFLRNMTKTMDVFL